MSPHHRRLVLSCSRHLPIVRAGGQRKGRRNRDDNLKFIWNLHL